MEGMGKILTVAIHKGGTGKTTVAGHLAFLASERRVRTLLVDLDSQANATDTITGGAPLTPGPDGELPVRTASDLFDTRPELPIHTARPGLDILPADDRLLAVDGLDLEAATVFAAKLRKLAADYDFVVVDTPPTPGVAMLAPLLGSDYVVAPVVPDPYSMRGIEGLISRVQHIRQTQNPDLVFLGLLVNKFRTVSPGQTRVLSALQNDLGAFVIPHTVPQSSSIEDAAHTREPVWHKPKTGSQRLAGIAVRKALSWVLDRVLAPPALSSRTAPPSPLAIGASL